MLTEAGPEFATKWPRWPLYSLVLDPRASYKALVDPVMALIERNASDPPCISLFLYPELTTETLMPSRKTQIYTFSNSSQDSLPVSAHQPAVACEQSR